MARSSRWMVPVLALFAITAVGVSPTTCGDVARIKVDLQRSPIESNARGAIRVLMDERQSSLELLVRHLEPESEYLLLVDDVERTRFTTNPRGSAHVRLQYYPEAGVETLDFDPRGKLHSVSDGSAVRLSAVVSGPLEPPRIRVWERATIPATGPDVGGHATGLYRTSGVFSPVFEIELRGVAAGIYRVLVDGTPVAEVGVDGLGMRSIRFVRTPHLGLLQRRTRGGRIAVGGWSRNVWAMLDFEPRGAWLEVVHDGGVLFAGPMRAQVALPEEAEACSGVDLQVPLTPVLWFGSGDASLLSEEESCDHEFRVTARGLAAANYELWVGDEMVGMLPVRNWPGGTAGELRFDTQPDDPDELPLEFDPRGRLIEVRRPMFVPNLYLTALFPSG